MTQLQPTSRRVSRPDRLPLAGLVALGTAGFVTIMTEALPAGILPAMSGDLGVTQAAAGQTVTVYAIGSALAAVPLTAATIGWPRRRLLVIAIAGFAVANTITAISHDYILTMASRFLAGVVAGLLWALLAGYARRMVTPQQRGKAMAIAMAGTPVALSIGVPAGTFLSDVIGWRYTFGIMTLLALILIGWVLASVPNFPGQAKAARLPLRRTLAIPGMAAVLVVTLAFVLAHNILYTYIAPYLAPLGLADRVDIVLLVFGAVSLLSIWITGALIDRHLRPLIIASCALFASAALALGLFAEAPWLLFASVGVWGLAFGGAATLLQTASAEAAGAAGDVAQSLVVTCWNIGIAGGAITGGLLLAGIGPSSLPWAALVLLVPALIVTIAAHAGATNTSSPPEK
ncbi:putative MFS family arabinose efflux permease [Glaciihabitans tibetensis]|uniref:Putative MFS family arabinose efflux permease n=1 Tax=Glaciihabitans tibetensis TaxID=1266600 RepID=A0A2T0V5T1_9MICO|nr:MFS transporter [Glaciihabitans tibetensis]PRY65467.1 putative MFS family arabinose efflux permease [Glaciihabitans tibetensis]